MFSLQLRCICCASNLSRPPFRRCGDHLVREDGCREHAWLGLCKQKTPQCCRTLSTTKYEPADCERPTHPSFVQSRRRKAVSHGNTPQPYAMRVCVPASRIGARTLTKRCRAWPCRRWPRDEMPGNTYKRVCVLFVNVSARILRPIGRWLHSHPSAQNSSKL